MSATLPNWIEDMIEAMAQHVNSGCGEEEARRIGALVGATAATLYPYPVLPKYSASN